MLAVGVTAIDDVVAPVLQLYVNDADVGVGAVVIVAVVEIQFTVLVTTPFGVIAELFANKLYDTVVLQLLLVLVTVKLYTPAKLPLTVAALFGPTIPGPVHA